jgi:hypothetical protein
VSVTIDISGLPSERLVFAPSPLARIHRVGVVDDLTDAVELVVAVGRDEVAELAG